MGAKANLPRKETTTSGDSSILASDLQPQAHTPKLAGTVNTEGPPKHKDKKEGIVNQSRVQRVFSAAQLGRHTGLSSSAVGQPNNEQRARVFLVGRQYRNGQTPLGRRYRVQPVDTRGKTIVDTPKE